MAALVEDPQRVLQRAQSTGRCTAAHASEPRLGQPSPARAPPVQCRSMPAAVRRVSRLTSTCCPGCCLGAHLRHTRGGQGGVAARQVGGSCSKPSDEVGPLACSKQAAARMQLCLHACMSPDPRMGAVKERTPPGARTHPASAGPAARAAATRGPLTAAPAARAPAPGAAASQPPRRRTRAPGTATPGPPACRTARRWGGGGGQGSCWLQAHARVLSAPRPARRAAGRCRAQQRGRRSKLSSGVLGRARDF